MNTTDAARLDATAASTWRTVLPLLVPIAAWLGSLGLSWLVQDFTCTAAMTAGAPPPGTALLIVLLTMNAGLLVITALCGFVSGRMYRRGRHAESSLARFIGVTGIIFALFFGFGIVLIGAMPLALEVC